MGDKSGPSAKRPEQTSEERKLARRGADQWNRYVREYVPVALNTIERSQVTEGDRRNAAADSAASAVQQTPRASTIAERAAGGMEGGAAIAGLQDAASEQATMAGVGEAERRFEQDQRGHGGLMQAVSTGHGVDALADSGYRSMAQGATQESIGDAQADFAEELREQRERQNLARTAVGAAMGGVASGLGGAAQGAQAANTMSQNWNARGMQNPRLTEEDQAVNQATATASRNIYQSQLEDEIYGDDPMRNVIRGAYRGASTGTGY